MLSNRKAFLRGKLVAGNVLHESSSAQGVPLTFTAYVAPMAAALTRREFAPVMRVQVRKFGAVLCGKVLEAAPARPGRDVDLFKVDCYLGQLWFPATNVRQCSGLDGRCTCTDQADAPGGARACADAPGAFAVPPGNTGTTVVEVA